MLRPARFVANALLEESKVVLSQFRGRSLRRHLEVWILFERIFEKALLSGVQAGGVLGLLGWFFDFGFSNGYGGSDGRRDCLCFALSATLLGGRLAIALFERAGDHRGHKLLFTVVVEFDYDSLVGGGHHSY